MIRPLLLTGLLLLQPAPEQVLDEVPAFHEYDPPSTLVVPETAVPSARYPFVDAHAHLFDMPEADLEAMVRTMDELNLAVFVNLSGRGFRRIEDPDGGFRFAVREPEFLQRSIAAARRAAPGRFVVFTNVDFDGIGEAGWGERAVAALEADVAEGARGLKIYKSLGMETRDVSGLRVPVDDPRLDPIWARCGELGIPVLVHSADPAPFWQPRDRENERLYEMMERPERHRDAERYPPWEQIVGEQWNVFRKHPKTVFINAHLGWMGNDLGRLGRLLDEHPNVYTEIGEVLAELGRQPRFARDWLVRYQDRVLFGKDAWEPDEYRLYFRILETDDDYVEYYRRRHAFWRIYGLDLPDEVLRKIYYRNALRILPGLDRSLFPD